jgi:hypothetical protein
MGVSYGASEQFEEATRKAGHRCEEVGGTLCTICRCGSLTIMAKSKRKPSKFSAGREARRRAREAAGPPPAERVIPDKRLKPPKHKKDPRESSEQ